MKNDIKEVLISEEEILKGELAQNKEIRVNKLIVKKKEGK